VFFVSYLLKTLIPGVVGGLFKSGVTTLDAGSAYYDHIEQDRSGLYEAVASMREDAAALEEKRGFRYNQVHRPTPDVIREVFGRKDLFRLDATELTEAFGPFVPYYRETGRMDPTQRRASKDIEEAVRASEAEKVQ